MPTFECRIKSMGKCSALTNDDDQVELKAADLQPVKFIL